MRVHTLAACARCSRAQNGVQVAQEGFRTDEVLRSKLMEVKQRETWEMRPHRVGVQGVEVKQVPGGATYGVTKVGPEVFPRSPNPTLNLSGMPKGYSAANSEYLSSTERKRLQAASMQQQQRVQAAQYRA